MATIRQTIALDGASDVKRQLADLGKTGEDSFSKVSSAGEKVDFGRLSDALEKLSKVLEGLQDVGAKTADALNKIGTGSGVAALNGEMAKTAETTSALGSAVSFLVDKFGTFAATKIALGSTNDQLTETNRNLLALVNSSDQSKAALAALSVEGDSTGRFVTALNEQIKTIDAQMRNMPADIDAVTAAFGRYVDGIKAIPSGALEAGFQVINRGLLGIPGAARDAARSLQSVIQQGFEGAVAGVIPTIRSLADSIGGVFANAFSTENIARFVGALGGFANEVQRFGALAATTLSAMADAGAKTANSIAEGAKAADIEVQRFQGIVGGLSLKGISADTAIASLKGFNAVLDATNSAVEAVTNKFDPMGTGINVIRGGVDTLGPALKAAQGAFGELRVELKDSDRDLRDTDAVLADVFAALRRLDSTQMESIAGKLKLGELLPLIRDTRVSIEDLVAAFAKTNRAFSPEQFAISKAFEDAKKSVTAATSQIEQAIQRTSAQIGLLFAPSLTRGAGFLAELFTAAAKEIDAARPEILSKVEGFRKQIEDALTKQFGTPEQFLGNVALGILNAIDALTPAIQTVDRLFSQLAAALNSKFGTTVTGTFLEIAAAAGVLTAAFGSQLPVIGPLIASFGTLLGSLSGFLPILIPLGIAVVAFWGQFSTAARAAFTGVSQGAAAFKTGLAQLLQGDFAGAWASFKTAAIDAFEGIKAQWPVIWASMKDVAVQTFAAIKAAAPAIWDTIKSVAIAIWPSIRDAAVAIFPDILAAARAIFADLKAAAAGVWDDLKTQFPLLAQLERAFTAVESLARVFGSSLVPKVDQLSERLGPATTALNRLLGTDLTAGEVGTIATLLRMAGVIDDKVIKSLEDGAAQTNSWLRLFDGFNAVLGFFESLGNLITNSITGLKEMAAVTAALLKTIASPVEVANHGFLSVFKKELADAEERLGIFQDTSKGVFRELSDDIQGMHGTAGILDSDFAGWEQSLGKVTDKARAVVDEFQKTGKIDLQVGDTAALQKLLADVQALKEEIIGFTDADFAGAAAGGTAFDRLAESIRGSVDAIKAQTSGINDADFSGATEKLGQLRDLTKLTADEFAKLIASEQGASGITDADFAPGIDAAAQSLRGFNEVVVAGKDGVINFGSAVGTFTTANENLRATLPSTVADLQAIVSQVPELKARFDELIAQAPVLNQALKDALPAEFQLPPVRPPDLEPVRAAFSSLRAEIEAEQFGPTNPAGQFQPLIDAAVNAKDTVAAVFQTMAEGIVNAFAGIPGAVDTALAGISGIVSSMVASVNSSLDALIARIQEVAAAAASVGGGGGGGGGGGDEGFASGGHVRGRGGPRSDSIIARLSNGEYVIQAAAVKRYGLGVLNALNSMRLKLPGLAGGGMVQAPAFRFGLPSFAGGGLASVASAIGAGPSMGGVPVHLHVGDRTFVLQGATDVVGELHRHATAAKLSSAGRKPAWVS